MHGVRGYSSDKTREKFCGHSLSVSYKVFLFQMLGNTSYTPYNIFVDESQELFELYGDDADSRYAPSLSFSLSLSLPLSVPLSLLLTFFSVALPACLSLSLRPCLWNTLTDLKYVT